MTRLAFAAKCGRTGLVDSDAPNRREFNKDANAAAPIPVAAPPKKCRRVICSGSWFPKIMSFFADGFVEVQDCARHSRIGRKFHRIKSWVCFRFADAEQTFRSRTVLAKTGFHSTQAIHQHVKFRSLWL